MNKAEEFPLGVDLLLAAQREAIELLVVPEVAEDGFDDGKALAVPSLAFFAVDRPFHLVSETFFAGIGLAPEEADLPDLGFVRGAQAFLALPTRQARRAGVLVRCRLSTAI
mgnify:CR=1 FL=1